MKIASWNVNSLKVRLPQLIEWLKSTGPDIVCLQETKLEDANFPAGAIQEAGYHVAFAGQKTYNGVAVLSKSPQTDITIGNPLFADEQKRIIAVTVNDIRAICAYVPNGQALDSDKYTYKLAWLEAFHRWVSSQTKQYDQLFVAGDFNIAPEDQDVHDPKVWAGQILCSALERKAFNQLTELGLHDSFRLFQQPEKSFSWWDYRMLGFQRNRGLRIDHILLSTPLAARCTSAGIDKDMRKQERPSDHAPVFSILENG